MTRLDKSNKIGVIIKHERKKNKRNVPPKGMALETSAMHKIRHQ